MEQDEYLLRMIEFSLVFEPLDRHTTRIPYYPVTHLELFSQIVENQESFCQFATHRRHIYF
jgi:hypothetical protein